MAAGHALTAADAGPLLSALTRDEAVAVANIAPPAAGHAMGNHSGLICPECGGGLDETGFDEHVHFRCRVVHAFGAETLLAAQEEETEQALWAAVRLLEDRSTPLDKLEEHARGRGDDPVARHYGRKARESTRHANRLRQLVEHDAGESPTDEDGVEASAGG